MIGREPQKENDLFFTCSLIEYIARSTKNASWDVVNALGQETIKHIYDLADVYHCENIDSVADQFITKSKLPMGQYDNISTCKYSIPSYFDMGRIYQRLISALAIEKKTSIIETLFFAYNHPLSALLNNFNAGFYYDAPYNIMIDFLDYSVL